MKSLPFDCHNHVHMGPSEPLRALMAPSATTLNDPVVVVRGMAVMSTHPRDYANVLNLTHQLPQLLRSGVRIVPGFGVHPWWLHELTDRDWQRSNKFDPPKWIKDLEETILTNPDSIVGETGLDGFHFDPSTNNLTSPMENQIEAFRLQMELAARLQRPVSLHSVQSFGPLLNTLSELKKSTVGLPPKIYFHAFGGKVGTVDQILAICGRRPGQCYFGFAPVVNFRSHKTADVIRKVGIERIVLETDHEDAALVPNSLIDGIRFIADALELSDIQEVVDRTTENAFELYGL